MKRFNILSIIFTLLLLLNNTSCSDEADDSILEGNDAFITSCAVNSNSASFAAYNISVDDTITIKVPGYINLFGVYVNIKISENATINPLPETILDWNNPVEFTVTSANGAHTNKYVVDIIVAEDSKVYEGAVEIKTQTELNNFFASGYTEVQNIIIYGQGFNDPIKDFSAMSSLKRVPGNLFVYDVAAREIVVENLESVGNFYVNSVSATKVRLPNLKFVAERFKIGNDNPGPIVPTHTEMEEVYLPKLEYVGTSFILYFCHKLESLESLSNLSFVGSDFKVDGGVFSDLKGLEKLTTINGSFFIRGRLASLDGLKVSKVNGFMTLFCEDIKGDLSQLSQLSHIGVGLALRNSNFLTNFKGLENIKTPILEIRNFLAATSLEGIPQQSSFDYLTLIGFSQLTDLSALSKLERIESSFNLQGMAKLKNLDGLSSLSYVGESMIVQDFPSLENIDGLSNLTTIGGELKLTFLDKLVDVAGFSGISEVKSIYLYGLSALESLHGFHNITEITEGGLSILSCEALTHLDDLSGLTKINFYYYNDQINIKMNKALASYAGIGSLLQEYVPLGRRVSIQANYFNPTKDDIANGIFVGEGGTGI